MRDLQSIIYFSFFIFMILRGLMVYLKRKSDKKLLSIIEHVLEMVFAAFLISIALYASFTYDLFSIKDEITYIYVGFIIFMVGYLLTRFYKLYKLIKKK